MYLIKNRRILSCRLAVLARREDKAKQRQLEIEGEKVVDPLTNGGLYLLTNQKLLTYMGWQTLPQECKHVLVGREYMGWQTLPQECKHVLVGRE